MKKILKIEVEEGYTKECEKCPFGVFKHDWNLGIDEYTCNPDKNPFNCGKYDLTTLKFIEDEESS